MKKSNNRLLRAAASVVLAGALALGSFALPAPIAVQAASSPAKTTIRLDGYPLAFPVEPRIVNGFTMVPFRAIAEALGVAVTWDPAGKRVIASGGSSAPGGALRVELRMGSASAVVNGKAVALDAKPLQIAGTTMIPLGFFGRQFGAQVAWDPATRSVSIVSPKRAMHLRAFYAIRSYSQIGSIPSFNSVAFGWMRIAADGSLTRDGADFYWPPADGATTPESIVADASSDSVRPYLMVYGEDGHGELTKLLQSPALRSQAIAGMMTAVKEAGFGGITLDFEGLGWSGDTAQAQRELNTFVKELKAQTDAAGVRLSLAVFPLNGSYRGYDYKTLGQLADDLVVMAYNYGKAGEPEPADRVDEAIRLALKQVPAGKLLLGIESNNENEKSIGVKIGLAKRYGLKGVAVWRLGLVSQAEYAAIGSAAVKA